MKPACAAVAVAAVFFTGCTATEPAPAPTPAPLMFGGYLTVRPGFRPPVIGAAADPCVIRSDGYADIREGAQVTITDDTGQVVALDTLDAGKIETVQPWLNGTTAAATCNFPFVIDAAPERPFYGVEIAHRGIVRFSRDQVADSLHLTL